MSLGLKIGEGDKEKIGLGPFEFDLTPYSVTFRKMDTNKAIDISYKFLKDKPAMVIRYELTNVQDEEKEFFQSGIQKIIKNKRTQTWLIKTLL